MVGRLNRLLGPVVVAAGKARATIRVAFLRGKTVMVAVAPQLFCYMVHISLLDSGSN